jgi:alkylation response protein AidB-like acyl-CoA dehydrogenase
MTEETGFGTHLACGILRWDKIAPFPVQDAGDRRAGDQVIGELSSFLVREVNPAEVESSGALPASLLADLCARGLLNMRVGAELGGLGLSLANAFRVIETTASWTCAAGSTLAIQNGISAGAHLPAVPSGPLHDILTQRMAAGMISGSADTEAAGAANRYPGTTATPTSDGAAYILNGEKIFITNAPAAAMLCVSATIPASSGEQSRIFFVDSTATGVSVGPAQDFMGQRGIANAVVRLRDVRVPRDRMLAVAQDDWRLSERLSQIGAIGRLFIIAAPSLAIAKLCLHWQREFARRRVVDGRPLGGYEEVQRIITASLSDVLAMSSVIDWCLLAEEADLAFELYAVKNIASLACWRVVERTMSLLAAEGYETAASKARRGGQPLPLERFYRDARMLRIGGGVDFQVDNWGAQSVFERCYLGPRPAVTELPLAIESVPVHPRNREHLRIVADEARSFAVAAAELAGQCGDSGKLFEHEHTLINLHRIVSELLTMALVVAKSSGQPTTQELADAYCTAAQLRLRDYWQRVNQRHWPDHAEISRRWLTGEDFGSLLAGVITETPPALG